MSDISSATEVNCLTCMDQFRLIESRFIVRVFHFRPVLTNWAFLIVHFHAIIEINVFK